MKLSEVINRVIIVAYQEDTCLLEKAFREEGFGEVVVLRKEYTEEEKSYSRQSRCLLNHREAWMFAARSKGLSMIVEADFVPVKGMSALPLPFDLKRIDEAWGWLYACGGRVYELVDKQYVRGHSATTVAYVIGPEASKKIIPFVEYEFSQNDPKTYFPWDVYIRIYAQNQGVNMYLPYRSYGEHGGIPNKEHRQHGITQSHQADVLWGRLHFLPMYAEGSYAGFSLVRVKAKIKAAARLLAGRYIEPQTCFNSALPVKQRLRLIGFAFTRIFYPY